GNYTQCPPGIFLELFQNFSTQPFLYLLQQCFVAAFCLLGEVEFIIRHYRDYGLRVSNSSNSLKGIFRPLSRSAIPRFIPSMAWGGKGAETCGSKLILSTFNTAFNAESCSLFSGYTTYASIETVSLYLLIYFNFHDTICNSISHPIHIC